MMTALSLESKNFYEKMLTLAVPIAIQTLITSSLSMVDSLMVGQLGVNSIAAVGVGNKITTILILILQGFGSGAAIFASQYWGRRDTEGIKKVLYLSINIVTVFSVLFTVAVLLFTRQFIAIFTDDPHVIAIGASFLRLLSYSYLFTALTVVFSTILKSMGVVKLPLYISIIAIGINTLLNYLLIFGNFGFSEMGATGAAIGTLAARIIQTLLLFVLVWRTLDLSVKSIKTDQLFDKLLLKNYFVITIPSIINHAAWTLGETSYFWVYAQLGTEQLAAVTMVDPLLFFFMALFIGLSDASQVMVGNSIGGKNEDLAFDYAKRFIKLTFLLSIIAGIGIVLVTPTFLSIYKISSTAEDMASKILLIYAFLVTGKMLNMVNNIGVLRAGGDTKFVMYVDLIGVWVIGLPLALIGAFVLHLPVYLVFLLANSHEFARALMGIRRTFSKKWIRNLVDSKVAPSTQ